MKFEYTLCGSMVDLLKSFTSEIAKLRTCVFLSNLCIYSCQVLDQYLLYVADVLDNRAPLSCRKLKRGRSMKLHLM